MVDRDPCSRRTRWTSLHIHSFLPFWGRRTVGHEDVALQDERVEIGVGHGEKCKKAGTYATAAESPEP
jgi:hypothetical protein